MQSIISLSDESMFGLTQKIQTEVCAVGYKIIVISTAATSGVYGKFFAVIVYETN